MAKRVKRMLGDRLLLREVKPEAVTRGGIAIPETVRRDAPRRAVVVKAGPGRRNLDGTLRPTVVEEGQTVVVAKNRRLLEVEVGGETLLVGGENDVVAVEE